MALFQQSVITKHLQSLDQKQLDQKWHDFTAVFHHLEKQSNIRNSKEEQYQEGFLRELFVNIFGYTINPDVNFNLLTEQKNETNSKKADGAILIDGKVKAVIELKGTDTTDLGKIETQAFGYKNNQTECVYVITSNFEKLRFYIDNAVDFIEFNLFTLTRKDFDFLYCCLSFDNVKNNIPKHLKDESVSKESQITKKLYKDYSDFKSALYNNLVELNPQYDKLLLFKKTQKLLDRFLFIFFAEDRQLVPTNLIRRINLEWEDIVKVKRIPVSLYDRYKVYFDDLNTGAMVTLPAFGKKTGDAITAEFEIFAYNGGLFLPDEILDNVKIDDDILHKHSIILSDYDFDSDVDVNILGHIFENSLNEIDEIKSAIAGAEIDKTKTKRKKDGVFYTPKYITKYIVDNTIGKLCEEKKTEFEIIDEEFAKGRKNRNKTTIQKLDKSLHDYRDWLLQITICDPACGSGAFLNQALEFLIQEHKYIDELESQLIGTSLGFPGAELHILENNIYGVDLNDESVEIAKLSLWLRTAQKGRKLNSLNNNIKCGNSLIDDVSVAGDKAFSWEKEFPEVFKEKNKFAYHITTSLHDSRTSQRMIDYHARERRFEGTKPNAEVFPMTKEEEELIAKTVGKIAKEDNLNIAAFNLCYDHMHILLICEEEDIPKIIQKIKSKTAREVNILRGKTIVSPREHAPLTSIITPSTERGEKQNSLWTQKFGNNPIKDDNHFWNTVNYIDENKVKHNLPNNPQLKKIIESFVKSREDCFKEEYNGGFDVIIGNPPYVFARDNFSQEEKNYFIEHFESSKYQINTYLLFIEKSVEIIKNKGNYGLIIPNSWLMMYSGEGLRKFLLATCSLQQIINLEGFSFENANVETVILIAEKVSSSKNNLNIYLNNGKEFYFSHSKKQSEFSENEGLEFRVFLDEQSTKFNALISKNTIILDKIVEIKAGLKAYEKDKGEPKQTAEDVKSRPYDFKSKIDETTFEYLEGKDVGRYNLNWSGSFLKYGRHLAAPRTFNLFDGKKIIIREITGHFPHSLISTYSEDIYLFNMSNIAIIEKEKSKYSLKFILVLLNSTLMSYYFVKNTAKSVRKLFPKIILNDLRKFPIKQVSIDTQKPFIVKADFILTLNKDFQALSHKFSTYFSKQYKIEKLTGKLEKWYDLEFTDFIKELNKSIKNVGGSQLSKKDELDWMDVFEEYKMKAQELKSEIDKTDKEIDQMVYELYGLTEDEIKIVEGN